MKMTPVKSSAITHHGYDPATNKMRVTTHSGKTYEYDDVPIDRYAAFTGAASPGSFWNSRIKANHTGREIAKKED